MLPVLGHTLVFPAIESALEAPNGLLAVGGDLQPERLLAAYRQGIFPWYSPGQPILWWSPNPRMVLFPPALHIPRSLAKTLRHTNYEIRFNTAFDAVMHGCASIPRPDQPGTWISPEMITAYCQLYDLGWAHSAECWLEGELVGGLYGVAIGRMFYGESMFARCADASKVAFVHLVQRLAKAGYGMIDCQIHTAHLARFGAREIPRADFSQRLQALTANGVRAEMSVWK